MNRAIDSICRYFVGRGVNTLDVCYYTRTLENEDKPESTTILNDLILFSRNSGNFSENPSFNEPMSDNDHEPGEESNDDEPAEESNETLGPVEYLLANGADINFANVSEFDI